MGRELRKELTQAKERLRRLEEFESKNPRQRRENTYDQSVMRSIILLLEVKLGVRPSKRYKARRR